MVVFYRFKSPTMPISFHLNDETDLQVPAESRSNRKVGSLGSEYIFYVLSLCFNLLGSAFVLFHELCCLFNVLHSFTNSSSFQMTSPLNLLTSPASISSTPMSMDSVVSDVNPYDENDINIAG